MAGFKKVYTFEKKGTYFVEIKMNKMQHLENLEHMFEGCEELVAFDGSSINISKVQSLEALFRECKSLKRAEVSTWNVSNITNMKGLFQNTGNLTNIGDISNWDVSKSNLTRLFHYENLLTTYKNYVVVSYPAYAILGRYDISLKEKETWWKDVPNDVFEKDQQIAESVSEDDNDVLVFFRIRKDL